MDGSHPGTETSAEVGAEVNLACGWLGPLRMTGKYDLAALPCLATLRPTVFSSSLIAYSFLNGCDRLGTAARK